jgi:hypothetical protein
MMRIKLTTAEEMLAINEALPRNALFWNKGILIKTLYIITAMMNIITRQI